MLEKRILCPERVRKIEGSFAFIEHRFLRDGFWVSLSHDELLLYVLLVMAADRAGLSAAALPIRLSQGHREFVQPMVRQVRSDRALPAIVDRVVELPRDRACHYGDGRTMSSRRRTTANA